MAKVNTADEVLLDHREKGADALRAVGPRWSFINLTSGASTVTINGSDCILHSVVVNGSPASTACDLALYNNASGGTTTAVAKLDPLPATGQQSLIYDAYLGTGLVAKTTGNSAIDVTITYIDV